MVLYKALSFLNVYYINATFWELPIPKTQISIMELEMIMYNMYLGAMIDQNLNWTNPWTNFNSIISDFPKGNIFSEKFQTQFIDNFFFN